MAFLPAKRIEWIATVAAGIESNPDYTSDQRWDDDMTIGRATRIVDKICAQEAEAKPPRMYRDGVRVHDPIAAAIAEDVQLGRTAEQIKNEIIQQVGMMADARTPEMHARYDAAIKREAALNTEAPSADLRVALGALLVHIAACPIDGGCVATGATIGDVSAWVARLHDLAGTAK